MKKEDLTDEDFNIILSFVDANCLDLLYTQGYTYWQCKFCGEFSLAKRSRVVVHKETCLYHRLFRETRPPFDLPKKETWGEKTVRLGKIAEEQRINLNNLMRKTQEEIIDLPGVGTAPDPSLSMDEGEMAARENSGIKKEIKHPMSKAERYLLDVLDGVYYASIIVSETGMNYDKAEEIMDFVKELRSRE